MRRICIGILGSPCCESFPRLKPMSRRKSSSRGSDIAKCAADGGDYPGLGVWPNGEWWKRPRKGSPTKTQLRLPGYLRVNPFPAPDIVHFEWYVPVDEWHHRYFQFSVMWTSGLQGVAISFGLLAMVALAGACAIQWPGCMDGAAHGSILCGTGWLAARAVVSARCRAYRVAEALSREGRAGCNSRRDRMTVAPSRLS